jgi:uncharacterized phage-like protein YoqJ
MLNMNPNEGYSTCCFTGHRNLPWEKSDAIRYTVENLIYKLCENGCRKFISGGAIGFDTLAAEAVLKLKKVFPEVRLVMALPCRDQHIRWCKADRLRYEKLLSLADEVIYLTESYVTGCMHLRNKYMVDNSELCIAYFEKKGGGTEYTINYAQEKGRKVVNIAHIL